MSKRLSKFIDEDCILHVKAQVMTRDDNKGGWVPLGSGGMSLLALQKTISNQYYIHGRRISDKIVILKSNLQHDLQYTKVNPTFHHWRSDAGRFGLTFHSSTEAKIFEKAIKKLIESLTNDSQGNSLKFFKGNENESFMILQKIKPSYSRKESFNESTASTTASSPSSHSPSSSPCRIHKATRQPSCTYSSPSKLLPVGNDEVIVCACCCKTNDSQTMSSNISTKCGPIDESSPRPLYFTFPLVSISRNVDGGRSKESCKSLPNKIIGNNVLVHQQPAHKTQYNASNLQKEPPYMVASMLPPVPAPDSYVEFSQALEYSYPQLGLTSRENFHSSISTTMPTYSPTPIVIRVEKSKKQELCATEASAILEGRVLCFYCNEYYSPSTEGGRGKCPDAPDTSLQCIETISCCCCVRTVEYHCGNSSDATMLQFICKWTTLVGIALLVPCLWCYWPLALCHRCGIICGCCGGRHLSISRPI